jgi:hypothetical protein
MDHISVPPTYMILHITSNKTPTSRTNIYLTVSRFSIEEIANSKNFLMDSSLADVMSFDIGLHLIKVKEIPKKN